MRCYMGDSNTTRETRPSPTISAHNARRQPVTAKVRHAAADALGSASGFGLRGQVAPPRLPRLPSRGGPVDGGLAASLSCSANAAAVVASW